MKKKSIISVVIAVALVFLFFAGPLQAAKKAKIKIFSTDVYFPLKQRMQEVVDEYQRLHPNLEIELQVVAWGGSITKIAAMKAAGGAPDALFIIPANMWTFKDKGWLIPVDDVIADLGGDDYFMPTPAYIKVDGHYWGVPKGSWTNHIIYRKDLFDKKGLREPKTWDDMLTAAKALTEDLDGDGKIDRYGIVLPLKRDYAIGTMFLSFLWGNGGHVLDKNGNVVFNSPETIETMKFMKKLFKYAPPGVADYSWLQLVETYTQDKAAMTSYSAMSVLSKAIEKNKALANGTSICPYPSRLPGQTPKTRWGTEVWVILKDSKHPEVAKDFIKFFMEPKGLVKYYLAEQIYVAPAEKPIIEGNEYWKGNLIVEYKDVMRKYIDLCKYGVDPVMEHPGIVQPNTTIINQRLFITDCIQEVVLGNVPVEEAVAKAHKKMEAFVASKK